jgi:hypothetical protein
VGEHVGAKRAENRLEDGNGDEANDQDVKRSESSMGQHLVGDDLEEQRRDQREQLQKERRDKDLSQ